MELGGQAWQLTSLHTNLVCFNGAFYIDATSKPTFANSVVARYNSSEDYNTGQVTESAFVNDNPIKNILDKADAAGNSSNDRVTSSTK